MSTFATDSAKCFKLEKYFKKFPVRQFPHREFLCGAAFSKY